MFHLDAWVHFDEEELTGVGINEKLNGSRCLVTDFAADPQSRFQNAVTHLHVQIRSRRDFDDLLVTSLHTAVAFVQVNQIAVMVAQQLHLNVLRAADEFFDEYVRAAKRRHGLTLSRLELSVKL